MREDRLRELLDRPAPDERSAEERGWRVVRPAFSKRSPSPRRSRALRALIALSAALAVTAAVLTPAGAARGRLAPGCGRPGPPGRAARARIAARTRKAAGHVSAGPLGSRAGWVAAPAGRLRRRVLVAGRALRRGDAGAGTGGGRSQGPTQMVACPACSGLSCPMVAERLPDRLPERTRPARGSRRRDGRHQGRGRSRARCARMATGAAARTGLHRRHGPRTGSRHGLRRNRLALAGRAGADPAGVVLRRAASACGRAHRAPALRGRREPPCHARDAGRLVRRRRRIQACQRRIRARHSRIEARSQPSARCTGWARERPSSGCCSRGRGDSATWRGHRTGSGCWRHGRAQTSGSSSGPASGAEEASRSCSPSRTSRSSSGRAPSNARASPASAAGAARADRSCGYLGRSR